MTDQLPMIIPVRWVNATKPLVCGRLVSRLQAALLEFNLQAAALDADADNGPSKPEYFGQPSGAG